MCKENEFKEEEKELLKKILENTSVNFLLGAGASYIKTKENVPFPLMKDLLSSVSNDLTIKSYYESLIRSNDSLDIELCKIYEKYLFSKDSNIEEFLSKLEAFINLIEVDSTKKNEIIDQKNKTMTIILERIKNSDYEPILLVYKNFYNTLIKINKKSEKISTKKYNVFTTNYDMLNEAAMEQTKLYYYSGFFGIYDRKFNMSYYNYSYTDTVDLYGHKYYEKTNYINLYKLHGSLSWKLIDNELIEVDYKLNNNPVIIYPSMTKYNITNLIVYYQSLLREFSSKLQKTNSSLFIIGNSLGDEHLLKIIENCLDLENFNLIIFSFSEIEKGSVIEKLNTRDNVYVYTGSHCTLSGFSSIYD